MSTLSVKSRAEILANIQRREKELADLEEVASRLRETIEKEKSLISLIRLIPPEILKCIFGHLIEGGIDDLHPLAKSTEEVHHLMLVNKRWQSVITRSPAFWTVCELCEGISFTKKSQQWILRSANLPLQASVVFTSPAYLQRIWKHILQNVRPRISSLRLAVVELNTAKSYELHVWTDNLESIPNLTNLTLENLSEWRDGLIEDAPTLRLNSLNHLHLIHCWLAPQIEAPALRTLRCNGDTRIPASRIWQTLAAAPHISEITFREVSILGPSPLEGSDSDKNFADISLKHLRTLQLVLRTESIDEPDVNAEFHAALFSNCHLSQSALHTLEFSDYELELPSGPNVGGSPHSIRLGILDDLASLTLHTNMYFTKRRLAKAMVGLILGSPRLESLTLISTGPDFPDGVLDIILQCLLESPNSCPKIYMSCPRLNILNLQFGKLRWPAILQTISKQRGDSQLLIEVNSITDGDLTGVRFYTGVWAPSSQNEAPPALHQLFNDASPAAGAGIVERLLEIESPEERLDLICNLLACEGPTYRHLWAEGADP